MFLQQDVYAHFKHEGIIDGDHADLGPPKPAGLAATSMRGVHDVVAHQEESLQHLV